MSTDSFEASMDWLASGSGFTAQSPDELMLALSRIGTLNTKRRFVWRGVPDHRWRIKPSLVRELEADLGVLPDEIDVRRRELAAIRETRRWGIGRDLGALATDLHILALLQHHGVHTRLLDVTPNPMTALWFACQKTPKSPKNPSKAQDVAGAIFAFDITDAHTYTTVNDEPTWGSLSNPNGWSLRSALRISAVANAPFLVSPALPDARMQAQEGIFPSFGGPAQTHFARH